MTFVSTRTREENSSVQMPSSEPLRGILQRKCACGGSPGMDGECAECRRKRLALQSCSTQQPGLSTVPPVVHEVLSSPGQPLDEGTRAFMEPRFEYDFSQVRVHTDDRAAESAQAVNALAYTIGRDVVFGAGQYAPGTSEGRKLMAHELTHVVQQGQITDSSRLQGKLAIGQADDAYEHEANVQSASVMEDHRIDTPLMQAHFGIARQVKDKPPAGGASKTISVDMVSLRDSNRDPLADLDFANRVFLPCNVQFAMKIGRTVSPELSDKWLGGDTDLEKQSTCGRPTAEEKDTFSGATNELNLSSRIRAFYVSTISSRDRGYSLPPYCATGDAAALQGMVVVSNSGMQRTLAHELGHVLLNSGVHPPDTNNLMHETNTATGEQLTPEQCATINANA